MTALRSVRVIALALALVGVVAVAGYLVHRQRTGLPAPGSPAYEETTRLFYRGLAALQVGLIDDAKREFAAAAAAAPGEPAPLANLALAHLRLGEFDAARPPLEQAAALAPSSGEVAFLQGRLESARGQRDEGIRHLRRAVELAPANPQVRMTLVQEIEYAAGPDADAEAQRLLETMVEARPDNPALLVERARLAAKRGDGPRLADSVSRLERFVPGWPPEVVDQFRAVQQAAGGNPAEAARAVAFLRNVLARVPAYLESRASVTPSAELIALPLDRFLRLPVPAATPSPADAGLTYAREPIGSDRSTPWSRLMAVSLDGERPPAVFGADAREIQRVDRQGPALALPGDAGGAHAVVALDWNHDFLVDLFAVGPAGARLYLQSSAGEFADDTERASAGAPSLRDGTGAWAADVEMDGDLDVVVGRRAQAPVVLRNNGDGTWRAIRAICRRHGAARIRLGRSRQRRRSRCCGPRRTRRVARPRQPAGRRVRASGGPESAADLVALALGDVDARWRAGRGDARQDVARSAGRRSESADGASRSGPNGRSARPRSPRSPRALRDCCSPTSITTARSTSSRRVASATGLWLAGEGYALTPLNVAGVGTAEVTAAADLNDDGQLDLVALDAGRPVRLLGRARAGYHWQVDPACAPRRRPAISGSTRSASAATSRSGPGCSSQKQAIAGPVRALRAGRPARRSTSRGSSGPTACCRPSSTAAATRRSSPSSG